MSSTNGVTGLKELVEPTDLFGAAFGAASPISKKPAEPTSFLTKALDKKLNPADKIVGTPPSLMDSLDGDLMGNKLFKNVNLDLSYRDFVIAKHADGDFPYNMFVAYARQNQDSFFEGQGLPMTVTCIHWYICRLQIPEIASSEYIFLIAYSTLTIQPLNFFFVHSSVHSSDTTRRCRYSK